MFCVHTAVYKYIKKKVHPNYMKLKTRLKKEATPLLSNDTIGKMW